MLENYENLIQAIGSVQKIVPGRAETPDSSFLKPGFTQNSDRSQQSALYFLLTPSGSGTMLCRNTTRFEYLLNL
jgi:hypothetical protein